MKQEARLKVVVRLLCPHCEGGIRITMDGSSREARPVRCPYPTCNRMFTHKPEAPKP